MKHEEEKKIMYNDRIMKIEQGTFTLLKHIYLKRTKTMVIFSAIQNNVETTSQFIDLSINIPLNNGVAMYRGGLLKK